MGTKNDDTFQSLITEAKGIPTTITSIKKYFDNIWLQNNGGQVCAKVRIRLPVTSDRETFETDFKGFKALNIIILQQLLTLK